MQPVYSLLTQTERADRGAMCLLPNSGPLPSTVDSGMSLIHDDGNWLSIVITSFHARKPSANVDLRHSCNASGECEFVISGFRITLRHGVDFTLWV
jgi:hypothetical protein